MKEPRTDAERKLNYSALTGQYMTGAMRAKFREGVDHVLPNLIALGKGEIQSAPHSVQVRAADVITKYAIGERPILMIQKNEWLTIVGEVTAKYIKDRETFLAWGEEIKARFIYQL